MISTTPWNPDAHLSTLRLHQLRLGELEPAVARAAQDHVDGCSRCAARLRHQAQVRAEFVLRPLPDALRAPPRRGTTWWRLALPLLLASAALGLLVLRGPASPEGIRMRGTLPEMEVWVATEEGPRQLRDEERLEAGDRVAIKYDARGASHVGFAGRDNTGQIEVYGIFEAGDGLVAAPFGLELDNAPGDQELFVVTGDARLDVIRVKEAIRGNVSGGNGHERVQRAVVTKRE